MVQLKGLIEYTDAELEQKAHEYLRRRPDVQFKIPVNVEALLQGCEFLGDLDTVPGIGKYTRTGGVVCRHRNEKDLMVYLDEDLVDSGPKATYYAVVAEELAHIVLHQSIFIQVKSFPEFLEVQRSPEWHGIERDARVFSAAVRMPYKNLALSAEETYPAIVDEHGFGDIQETLKLVRNALAERFVVPPNDMQRRLLSWPCQIVDRVSKSVQVRSNRLIPHDWEIRAVKPGTQKTLF